MPVLGIPNNNVRAQYYRYLQKKLMVGMQSELSYVPIAELSEGFREAAFNGNVRLVLETAVRQCSLNSSCRQLISGECLFQAYLLAYLALNDIYGLAPETEVNHGYSDILLYPQNIRTGVAYSYLIELKYHQI